MVYLLKKVTSALLGCHARGLFGDWKDMQVRALLPEHRRQFKKRTGKRKRKKERGFASSSGRLDVYSEDQHMNLRWPWSDLKRFGYVNGAMVPNSSSVETHCVRSILVGQCRPVEANVKSLTCRKCMLYA